MDEERDPLENAELTQADLEALAAFEALGQSDGAGAGWSAPPTTTHDSNSFFVADEEIDDMVKLFIIEACEDIMTMKQALQQLEYEDHPEASDLIILKRTAHKLKGAAGTVGCDNLSTIALYTEVIIRLIGDNHLEYLTGLIVLVHAIHALEETLNSIINNNQEDTGPLYEFEDQCALVNIDLKALNPKKTNPLTSPLPPFTAPTRSGPLAELPPVPFQASPSLPRGTFPLPQLPGLQVDSQRLEQLILHTERLSEQRASLESAQTFVRTALDELNTAQSRLQRLEMLISTLQLPSLPRNRTHLQEERLVSNERPTSSLIARILDESSQRTGHAHQRRSRLHLQHAQSQSNQLWDDMEIDRYTESDVLAMSLNEAITDVSLASSQLHVAFSQLNQAIEQHIEQANVIQGDALKLRSVPFSILLPQLKHILHILTEGWSQKPHLEIIGEQTEIDQDLLEDLAQILLNLLQNCLMAFLPRSESETRTPTIWFHIQSQSNEITVAISFSMPIQGSSLDEINEIVRRRRGSLLPHRNQVGGISFVLRIPRSRGTIKGLLARAGTQQVIIPFTQIRQVAFRTEDQPAPAYQLNTLLGFPRQSPAPAGIPLVLMLEQAEQVGVEIEETQGEVELLMKPLAPHLQRPGLLGSALNGSGKVILVVDLFELIKYRQHYASTSDLPQYAHNQHNQPHNESPVILIADDSVSIRQSLHQALQRTGCQVMEARDGLEALEVLLENQVDLLLLDIEMPNLNGYGLLNILPAYPKLNQLKIIMLSSRSSEKHRQQAFALGAQGYLTKPSPRDILLSTIQQVLGQQRIPNTPQPQDQDRAAESQSTPRSAPHNAEAQLHQEEPRPPLE